MTNTEFSIEDYINKQLKEHIDPLEKRLGLSSRFFGKLLADRGGDWSFIIKLSALIEVAVAHYLSSKLNRSELQDTFLRLDLASKYTGQIAFLKALGLLDEHRSYICAIAQIRNNYAHDISNVMLKFEEYFEKDVSKESFKELRAAFRKILPTSTKDSAEETIRKAPRLVIWILGMKLLIEIYRGVVPMRMGLLEYSRLKKETDAKPT